MFACQKLNPTDSVSMMPVPKVVFMLKASEVASDAVEVVFMLKMSEAVSCRKRQSTMPDDHVVLVKASWQLYIVTGAKCKWGDGAMHTVPAAC